MTLKFTSTENFGLGQSLILPNRPEGVTMEQVSGIVASSQNSLEKYGFWDSNNANFHTFYPDLTADEIAPRPGDYVYPVFRLLSEVIVNKKWNPVDFSKPGVLKNSLNLIVGQTLYPNHDASVGNELGVVSSSIWQKSYTTADGVVIPAGINGEFKIDAKLHPNIARNVMSDPPAIHSNSVTVQFEWEPSHYATDMDKFWNQVGQFGEDGEMVRRIVTKIIAYHETSLVAHGADPYAQRVNEEGVISNPKYADTKYSLSEQKQNTHNYYISYRNDISKLSDTNITIPADVNKIKNNDNKKTDVMNKTLLTLAAMLAMNLEEGKEELSDAQSAELVEKFKALKTSADSVVTLTEDLRKSKEQVVELQATIEGNKTKIERFEAAELILKDLRETVKASYVRLLGDNANAEQVKLIEESNDLAVLKSFKTDYEQRLEEKFPSSCTDCGSHSITKASSTTEDPNKDLPKKFSHADAMKKLQEKSVRTNNIHTSKPS